MVLVRVGLRARAGDDADEDDDERRRHHRRVVSSITTAHFSPRRSARGSEGRACTRNTQLARRSLVKRNESGVE
jgi:hypothetical protein